MENLAEFVGHPCAVGCEPRLALHFGARVVEHAVAETHAAVVAGEDIVVLATLAALPEFLVGGEFGERDGFVAQTGVEFHHRQRCGDGEDFGVGESSSGQFECLVLDTRRKTHLAELGVYDKTRGRDIVAMAPALDVAETYETVAVHRHDSFPPLNLVDDVLGGTAGNARAALKGRLVDELADEFGMLGMLLSGKHHRYLVILH